jgi:RNA polymerase sigma factor (sigma-70 family)
MLQAAYPVVTAIVRQTASRYRLSREDHEELRSYVSLKLAEDDGRRLKAFRGESSLHTYLVVVVKRLYMDLRNSQRGKWRASAAARRGGSVHERVEQLVYRDGYSPAQAYEYLTTNLSVDLTPTAFDDILADLPPRCAPVFDGTQVPDSVADERFRPDASLNACESEQRATRLAQALDAFVQTLAGEDRLIWALHFDDRVKSGRIAAVLKRPVQHVYARVDRIKQRARKHFASAGITPALLRRDVGGA